MAREPLDWYLLRFPRTLEIEQVTACLLAINGLSSPRRNSASVFQVAARSGLLEHHVAVPRRHASAARAQVERAAPGIGLEPCEPPPVPALAATWRLWLSTRRRPLDTADPDRLAHQLLVAIAGAEANEYALLRWVVGPVRRPLAIGSKIPTSKTESWVGMMTAPLIPPGELDSPGRRALRDKQGRPGWRVLGLVAIKASTKPRTRQLLGRITGALRTVQGPGVQLGVRRSRRRGDVRLQRVLGWPLALNVDELTGLIAWPLGDYAEGLPVRRVASRPLPPATSAPSAGRVVADGSYPGAERPLRQSAEDATFHTHLLGPTGSGKSVLIAQLVLQDIADGRSVVVVDPKGDLVTDVLARIPVERLDDVVVLDPADEAPLGLNPLAHQRAPELVADELLAVFRGLYDVWGPRVQDVLSSSLITLARTPDMTLCALPLLLTNPAFRRRLVSNLDDPLGLGGFWASYEVLSESERQQVIAPALNRVRPFLLRPQLRAVVGQQRPRFMLRELFTSRKIVLVSLARGLLGPDVANLLGGLFVSQLWNTVLSRAAVPAAKRHPVLVYIDEFQDVIHLNTPLPDVLAQARGLGVGFTLAHQHLGQLPSAVRSAVMANARSRAIWQLAADDASVVARTTPLLDAEDITSLGRFEIYASLVVHGRVTPFMSGRTRALSPVLQDPDDVRAISRRQYGVPRHQVESELSSLLQVRSLNDLSGVGAKRRRS